LPKYRIRWLDLRDNSKYEQPMRYSGLDPIPGGSTGDIFFLINGYKLVVDITRVQVSGVLFSEDYDTAFYLPSLVAVYPVKVAALVNTVQTTVPVVTGDLSAIVIPSAEEIADAVWNRPKTNIVSSGSIGEWVKGLLSAVNFLKLK